MLAMAVGMLAMLVAPGLAAAEERLHRRPVRLAEPPGEPEEADSRTLYLQDFEGPVDGASGEHRFASGRRGTGLHLAMPDGRFDIDASEFDVGAAGTVQWWVKPRPAAEVWRNQGWHYFLHVRPEREDGFQLDLWRHPRTSLRLSASHGLQPHGPIEEPDENIEIDTRGLDFDQWHQLLVSWDLTGDRQRIWLLVNGAGQELSLPPGTFQPGGFASIEFGNRPSGWNTPFIPMDGAVDGIHIRRTSIEERLRQD